MTCFCLFVCLFCLFVILLPFVLLLFLFYFSSFLEMGVQALIRKMLGFQSGEMHYNVCWPESLGSLLLWFGGGEIQSCNLHVWVLELNFASQIIKFESLFRIIYSFTEFIYFSIHLQLFIH